MAAIMVKGVICELKILRGYVSELEELRITPGSHYHVCVNQPLSRKAFCHSEPGKVF